MTNVNVYVVFEFASLGFYATLSEKMQCKTNSEINVISELIITTWFGNWNTTSAEKEL